MRLNNQSPSFFVIMGGMGLLAVLAGFAKTFIIPVSGGNFRAPVAIYVHAAFSLCWILLFVCQAFLINIKNYRLHKILGMSGLFIAAGAAITMLPAGVFMVEKQLKEGLGATAISGIVGICTSAALFLLLVLLGLIYRTNPSRHKRLMLLATIVILWPAWFRLRHYFPSVPRPDIWFALVLADSLIVVSWIWDKRVNGRVHPVLAYGGLLIIAENIAEVIMFDNDTWRNVARSLYQFLS